MPRNFFKLLDDVAVNERWWVKTPRDARGDSVNPDLFSSCIPIELLPPIEFSVRHEGKPLDFTFAAFDLPLLNSRTVNLLREFALSEFQIFPATVQGYSGDYFAVNFLDARKCVDESQSEFLKWTEADNRPDKLGKFRQITKLRIDPMLAADADIFRIEDFKVVLIASDRLQRAFEQEAITGVRFRPVC